MIRVESQPLLKRRNGFIVFLLLGIQVPEKIVGVCLIGDFHHALKSCDAFLRLSQIFVHQPQVVPGIGILRKLLRRLFQRRSRGLQFLLAHQRDAQIQPRHGKFWVRFQRLLKKLLRIRRPLLVHVRNPQRIEAVCLGRIRHCSRLFRSRGLFLPRRCARTHQQRAATNQK